MSKIIPFKRQPLHLYARRTFLVGAGSIPLIVACNTFTGQAHAPLADIEREIGGRIGVAAVNLKTGQTFTHRASERFAMCSTFKWLLVGFILQEVDQGQEHLDRPIVYGESDLVSWSPVTKPRVAEGSMTVGELCHATLTTSDNTAANLLLATLDGPAGFTARVRALGDTVTRLDRLEPQLNENAPGDPRDTTTPDAMLHLMEQFLFGNQMSGPSRDQLRRWMIANTTGKTRLRAGLPGGWTAGDRTGTSEKNANNNVAFAIAPEDGVQGPLLIVSFINAPNPASRESNAVHADIARRAVKALLPA